MAQQNDLSPLVFIRRALAVIFLPLLACIALAALVFSVAYLGQKTGLLYMRTESLGFSLIPFGLAVLAALAVNWIISKKAAMRVLSVAAIVIFAFIGTAAVFETINTKPIAAAAKTFKEIPNMTRERGNNGDKFSPAPSGFLPCIDFMGEGCPNITRTWLAPADRDLTMDDLQKSIDDSGWTDVKIRQDLCHIKERNNGSIPDCTADGMVGAYKATVRILKISDHWEQRMYLRLPTNVR